MKNSKFSQSFSSLKDTIDYKVQRKSVEFLTKIHSLMNQNGVSKKQLAERIGCSPAYISKLFNGSSNISLETMLKFADALDSEVNIQICQKHQSIRWIGVVDNQRKAVPSNFKHETQDALCGNFELNGVLLNDENFSLAA